MKARTKKFALIVLIPICIFPAYCTFRIFYSFKYVHLHCIKQASVAFRVYAGDHQGQFPFSTNGFGNALLLLAKEGYLGETDDVAVICGPDDDGHIFKAALQKNSVVPETQCSRVYIQGLSETNDPAICILFDRASCKGGDHMRSPWGHRVRELCLLDGSMQVIRDEDWSEFSRKQVELLVSAKFSRADARHFYPAAK